MASALMSFSGEENNGLSALPGPDERPPHNWSPRDGDWRIKSIARDEGGVGLSGRNVSQVYPDWVSDEVDPLMG